MSVGKIESDVCNSIPQIEKMMTWVFFSLRLCTPHPLLPSFPDVMSAGLGSRHSPLLSDVKTEMTGCIIYARAWLSYPVCIDFLLKAFVATGTNLSLQFFPANLHGDQRQAPTREYVDFERDTGKVVLTLFMYLQLFLPPFKLSNAPLISPFLNQVIKIHTHFHTNVW